MRFRSTLHQALLGREVTTAFVILAALYLIRLVSFQPLQIPAYLLIVTYDLIEAIFPVVGPYYPVAFPLYLYFLALICGAVARVDASRDGTIRRATGSVSLVVGLMALVFAVIVGGPLISPTDNPTPLVITGTTGIGLCIISWWLLKRLPHHSPVAS